MSPPTEKERACSTVARQPRKLTAAARETGAPPWTLSRCIVQWFGWSVAPLVFRLRAFGCEHLPARSAYLLVSNHQSFLDPVLIALATRREIAFMARESLFRSLPFRILISAFDAFPVRPGRADLTAVRTAVTRLRAGQLVGLFPEGTRTRDGSLAHFHPGFGMIAERAGVPIVPVAIEGAYDAWPRSQLLPRAKTISVAFGRPMAAGSLNDARSRRGKLGAEVREQVGVLRQQLVDMHRRLSRP